MAQYAMNATMMSPTRPSTAHSNISPRLIIYAPTRSQDSDVFEDNSEDPFADPMEVARRLPPLRLSNASPTIRTSIATYLDQPVGEDTAQAVTMQVDNRHLSVDPFQDPTAPLFPVVGKRNRLSDLSSQAPPSPTSDVSSTVSFFSKLHLKSG